MPNDQMTAAKHAISIARLPRGWTWELIDVDGITAAAGVAAHQKAAMGMAQRAAESFAASSRTELPDLVVFGAGVRPAAPVAAKLSPNCEASPGQRRTSSLRSRERSSNTIFG
jgi:hypothetical protein